MSGTVTSTNVRMAERAALLRKGNSEFARWAAGYGAIRHSDRVQVQVHAMVELLQARGHHGDREHPWALLQALDRLASAGMWLVVHQTYARNVYLDGRPLEGADFKPQPDGHTGGALNMVPAYAGYLALNALTGETRSWVMGQGHAVAAVDSLNLLVGNLTPAHAARYSLTDEGLTRFVRDFYSYRISPDGELESPLGSHVNPHTAGGIMEGGYLGFAELQYVHMPLVGEKLVTFLSDGAFEEQRGSDWAARWWRAEDCGPVMPVMIYNGRRIDQRTTTTMQGGVDWFVRHLELNGFDPIVFDGRDPAAFVCTLFEMEERLHAAAQLVQEGKARYPVRLPYGIAATAKGAGFPGEATNAAHNLPLGTNPSKDADAACRFNEGTRRLWVFDADLTEAVTRFQSHAQSGRAQERYHPLAHRNVTLESWAPPPLRPIPEDRRDPARWTQTSPMAAVDEAFVAIVEANPHLRPRVGNPDELASNRMTRTLDLLKHRVTDPEPGVPEALDGKVITALNEEAVVCAALANKGGLNMVVTYEAFAPKMLGAVRQEVIFAEHCNAAGRAQGWLSVPLVLTSNTYENSKNERSHQDPAMAEAMLMEPADVSRVLFPADYNTASVTTRACYLSRGQVWTMVVPKSARIADLFTGEEAELLLQDGGLRLDWAGHRTGEANLVLAAAGAYQLMETLRASHRLAERNVPHTVVYLLEPGRFRTARTKGEAGAVASGEIRERLFPDSMPNRVFVTHISPEVALGVLTDLHTGRRTVGLGYQDRGGTLSIGGMLFMNRQTWAHVVEKAIGLLGVAREAVLDEPERQVLDGTRSPHGVLVTDVEDAAPTGAGPVQG